MRAVIGRSTLLLSLVWVTACSRPQSEPAPAREPPASSAGTMPSGTSTTSGSPGPAPPPIPPTVTPPSALASKSAGPPRADCDGLFGPPAGAVKLCDEHVLGDGAEVHWTSWAVAASRAEAFRAYEQRAHGCNARANAALLSLDKGDERLSIHDASARDYPTCAAEPEPSHATVIVISTKRYRR